MTCPQILVELIGPIRGRTQQIDAHYSGIRRRSAAVLPVYFLMGLGRETVEAPGRDRKRLVNVWFVEEFVSLSCETKLADEEEFVSTRGGCKFLGRLRCLNFYTALFN